MPNITLADAKAALIEADQRRRSHTDGGFAIDLSVGNVNVIYDPKGTLINYGLPSMYTLPRANIAALQSWWAARHPNTGALLPPQFADGGWKINLQWTSTHHNLFNFHIAVPAE